MQAINFKMFIRLKVDFNFEKQGIYTNKYNKN